MNNPDPKQFFRNIICDFVGLILIFSFAVAVGKFIYPPIGIVIALAGLFNFIYLLDKGVNGE